MYRGHFPNLGHARHLPEPPYTFVDTVGREIAVREFGTAPSSVAADYEGLVEMYLTFDPAHRTLGIPPQE